MTIETINLPHFGFYLLDHKSYNSAMDIRENLPCGISELSYILL